MSGVLARFTLYDFVGYILPGAIGLFAISLLLSVFSPLSSPGRPEGALEWAAVVVASYFVGHLSLSISSLFTLTSRSAALAAIGSRGTDTKTMSLAQKVLSHYKINCTSYWSDTVLALEALRLASPDRDIYVARQGFCRGMFFSSLLLVLAAFACTFRDVPPSAFGIHMTHESCLAAGILSAVSVYCSVRRYRSFIEHELKFGVAEAYKRLVDQPPCQSGPDSAVDCKPQSSPA